MGASASRVPCVPAGLLAREHQELVDEACRAVDPGHQPIQSESARGRVRGPLQPLRLEQKRRQRRTQFVGGVGNEILLRGKGLLHAAQQEVQFVHQGPHLVRQTGLVDLRQIVGLAPRHLLAHARQRRKGGADDPPRQKHEQRRGYRDRQDGPQGQGAGHVLPDRHVLRHLDDARWRLQGVDPVPDAVRPDVGIAHPGPLRQQGERGRAEDLRPIGQP